MTKSDIRNLMRTRRREVDPEEREEADRKRLEEEREHRSVVSADDVIINRPSKDTGSIWYGILAFLLPILGLIAAVIFRNHNYIRNYKMLKRGAVAGLIVRAVIIAFFLLMLLIATL